MESNKIDEIFKRKLERHSLPVSDSAWSQVQSQMTPTKKKKPIIWMVAASISLLVLLTAGIVYNMENNEANMANIKIDLKTSHASIDNVAIPEQPQVKIKQVDEEEPKQPLKKSPVQPQQNFKTYAVSNKSKEEDPIKVEPLRKLNNLDAAVALNKEIVVPGINGVGQKKDDKAFGIKVEMYYNQQELAEAKPENTTNIFNKKANQLKSLASEYSLADLRSAKNELFASAFQNSRKELNN